MFANALVNSFLANDINIGGHPCKASYVYRYIICNACFVNTFIHMLDMFIAM